MIIKKLNHMDQDTLQEMQSIEKVCKEQDNLMGDTFLDTSLNFNPQMNSIFLLYEDGILVSFLFMFIPNRNESEISAFTLPKYRRRGFFKALLHEAVEELKLYNVPEILFVTESKSLSGVGTAKGMEAAYDFSEYQLRYNKINAPAGESRASEIKLYEPKVDDIEKIIDISMNIFEDSYDDARSMITKAFESPGRQQYLALLNGEFIGMISVSMHGEEASIFGFGILPNLRGKGYGREVLNLIIDSLLERNKDIIIDVNSQNIRAFNLYRSSGFDIEIQFDYYRKKII